MHLWSAPLTLCLVETDAAAGCSGLSTSFASIWRNFTHILNLPFRSEHLPLPCCKEASTQHDAASIFCSGDYVSWVFYSHHIKCFIYRPKRLVFISSDQCPHFYIFAVANHQLEFLFYCKFSCSVHANRFHVSYSQLSHLCMGSESLHKTKIILRLNFTQANCIC